MLHISKLERMVYFYVHANTRLKDKISTWRWRRTGERQPDGDDQWQTTNR